MSPIHAVIIAGGKGDRLGGVRKGDLRLGGRRLVDRVAKALGDVSGARMIATGPGANDRALHADWVSVPDLPSTVGGPLAGLAAAVAHLRGHGVVQGLLISAAVDTPLLPGDYMQRLAAAVEGRAAAFAAWSEQFYPPNAIWRIEALADLPLDVIENRAPGSLKALLRTMGAAQVDWFESDRLNPFTNVNTLEDLITLSKIAQSRTLSQVIHKQGD